MDPIPKARANRLDALAERAVKALESIAASLETIAHPLITLDEDGHMHIHDPAFDLKPADKLDKPPWRLDE